jgi:hypothetical protein
VCVCVCVGGGGYHRIERGSRVLCLVLISPPITRMRGETSGWNERVEEWVEIGGRWRGLIGD